MEDKKAYVSDLVKLFGYKQITGDETALNREITDVNVNRPGFELAGIFAKETTDRIVIIGEKEHNFIQTMDEKSQRTSFEYLTQDRIPTIIIAHSMPCPSILEEIATRRNFPILTSTYQTGTVIVDVISFLEEYFAAVSSVHGVLMQVYGHGVLLEGESGIGKSEIALELLKKGHVFVADDRVDCYRLHNKIYGEAPEILKNMLELRGIGLIDVEKIFGVTSLKDSVSIELIIRLVRWEADDSFDRLGLDSQQQKGIFGVNLPRLVIPVREGRNMADIVEAAVANYLLRQKGIDTFQEFDNRLIELMKKQKGE